MEPATVRGRLYQLSTGLPALKIPATSILAIGTLSPNADAHTQCIAKITAASTKVRSDMWDTVYGQVITFDDPKSVLPAIDRLEGFSPNGFCLYRRVLTPARASGRNCPVWLYEYAQSGASVRLAQGRWEEKSFGQPQLGCTGMMEDS